MHLNKLLVKDWLLIVGLGIVALAEPVTEYMAGDCTLRLALVKGLLLLLFLEGFVLFSIRARNRRAEAGGPPLKLKRRLFLDWYMIAGVGVMALVVPVWKYRVGDCAPHAALLGGLISLPVLEAIVLLAIRARNRRGGLPTERSLLVGAVVCSMLSAGGLWLTLGHEMSERDLIMTALSSKPISKIRPEKKAIFVQLLRKELKRRSDYQQMVSQIKPLDPPPFSNESFRSSATMQQEIDGISKVVTLSSTACTQYNHDMEEFRSVLMKQYPADLKSFDSRIRSTEGTCDEILSMEREFLDATTDLYGFAARNTENIRFFHGNLVSHNAGVWNTFAKKRNNCITLLQRLRRLLPKQLLA